MSKKEYLPAAVIGAITTAAYIYTMPPTVYWQDSGIYLTGVKVEGNVYSPGFPVYMILQYIWTHLIPVFSFTQKVHLFSAVSTGIMSVIVYLLLHKITEKKYTLFSKYELLEEDKESRNNKCNKIFTSLLGTAMISLNFNVWAQAINAEVYALHSLFLVLIIYLIVKMGNYGKLEKNSSTKVVNIIIYIGIIFGLSLGNHPMTVLLIPLFIFLLFFQKNILFHSKKLITAALIGTSIVVASYTYLPLIANTHPKLNWGNPNSINRFITHITGQAYVTNEQSFVLTDVSRYEAAFLEFYWEFGLAGLVLAFVGGVLLYKKDKNLTILLSILALIHIFFAIFYKQTTEYNSWLIPAHIAFAIFISYAIHMTVEKIRSWKNINTKIKTIVTSAGILVMAFLFFLIPHWIQVAKELDRREYYYAEDFGRNILRNIHKDSLVLMTGDQESSTTMYLQNVLNYRTDLILLKNIEIEQLSYSEGREDLRIRYPNLNIPENEFSNSDDSNDENTITNKLITANIEKRSVYLMSKSTIQLDQQYYISPAAVMWQVTLNPEDIDLKYWDFKYHDQSFYSKKERPLMSLKDSSKPGGINRVPFIQHMINFELQAWKNLGDWYTQTRECDKAKDAYLKMQRVQPNIFEELPLIRQSIEKCMQNQL